MDEDEVCGNFLVGGTGYGEKWRNSFRRNEEAEPKQ